MAALRRAYEQAKDAWDAHVTAEMGKEVKKPGAVGGVPSTKFVEAAWTAGQIPSSTPYPPMEHVTFTLVNCALTAWLYPVVLRNALQLDVASVLIGAPGCELPGPVLIQLRTTLQSIYKKGRNEWADKTIEDIMKLAIDLSRRIQVSISMLPDELFSSLHFALTVIEGDLDALKIDQVHKDSGKKVGQKLAQLKRHRTVDFAYGDEGIVKSLGKLGGEE